MEIAYIHGITKIRVFKKPIYSGCSYSVKENYKRRIGRKYLIFPIYETIELAVVYSNWGEKYVYRPSEFDNKKIFLEDKILYYYPHCTIYFNNQSSRDVFFKTQDELYKYVQNLRDQAPHLIIE